MAESGRDRPTATGDHVEAALAAIRPSPPTTRLEPRMVGRGLPVPPAVVLVAAISVFVGFALGFGIAPKSNLAPISSPTTATATASPVRTPLPSALPTPTASAYELPPAGGLTLAEALSALTESGMGFSPSMVISARVARYREVAAQPFSHPQDQWVWAIVIRGTLVLPLTCDGCATPPMTEITSQMIILDYDTGALLEVWGPVFP
jgi:hypothetical protein